MQGDDLRRERAEAARRSFAEADFGESVVGETGCWQDDGDYYSLRVYWESEGESPSRTGCFGVEFAPGTARVVETWHQ